MNDFDIVSVSHVHINFVIMGILCWGLFISLEYDKQRAIQFWVEVSSGNGFFLQIFELMLCILNLYLLAQDIVNPSAQCIEGTSGW